MSAFLNEWFNPAEKVLPEQIITGESWPYQMSKYQTVTDRIIIFKVWAALQSLTSSSTLFWTKMKLSSSQPRSEFWSPIYVIVLSLNACLSYTGFDRDLISRGRVKLIPVHLSPEKAFGPESLELFEEVYDKVTAQGISVRAVVSNLLYHTVSITIDIWPLDQIVCNPQNPLGRTYPRETLLAYAKFCQNKDLHLVSDEIYALSVYENKGEKAYSASLSD